MKIIHEYVATRRTTQERSSTQSEQAAKEHGESGHARSHATQDSRLKAGRKMTIYNGRKVWRRLNRGIDARCDDGTSQRRPTLCENAASSPIWHRGFTGHAYENTRQTCLHAPMRRLRLREQADQVCLPLGATGQASGHCSTPIEQHVTHDAESNDDKKPAQQDIN